MEIVFNTLSGTLPDHDYEADYEKIAKRLEEKLKIEKPEVCSVIFCSPDQIQEINRDYRNIDRPTDVISFALQDTEDDFESFEEETELGDIFINTQAIIDQAKEYGHSPRRESCFLFCHGLLHLHGYDHQTPEQEEEMFSLQREILDEVASRSV